MKLYYSKTSPFARKVIISALKLELKNMLELTTVDVFNDPAYNKINPLVKVPALEIKTGQILTNSPFICDYLNSISTKKNLFASAELKWHDLQLQSLADGMMDALVLRRLESLRTIDKQDPAFDQRQKDKVLNVLRFFNDNTSTLKSEWTIGEISLACALGYLEFRFANENLLAAFPEVQQWYFESKKTAWMLETQP